MLVNARSILFTILLLISCFSISAQEQPANDECTGAVKLVVNSDNRCTALYSGNTGYATQSRPSCIATGYEAKDVWFKFTATATTQRVTVNPLSTDNYIFEVFSGSCTNMISLACVNSGAYGEPDAALVNNLTVGAEYYIRVWMYFGAASPSTMFSVCVSTTTTLVNEDDCSGAMEVIPSATSQIQNNFFTINNTGATQSMPGCFGTAEDDVWFKFTATATRHRILIGTTNDINPVLELFSGSCGSLTSLSCRYVNNGSVYGSLDVDVQNLVPGTTYYYRVYGSGTNNIRTSIYSRMSTPDPPPANDECSGAISLTVNSDNRCTALYSGNTGYATQSRPSCIATGYEAKDVWFKFTATATTQRVTVNPLSSDNYIFQVFSGSCSNLVSLACVNTGPSGQPDAALVNNLTVGAEYYIRVWMYFGAASPSTMFSVCVSTTTTLVNEDDCSGAMEVIPSATSQIQNNFFTINNTGATQSMPGCFGTAEDDVWFKFTATATRHRILISTSNDINPVLELFNGSCGSLTSLSCRYVNNGSVYGSLDVDVQNLVPGTTYYYRVYGSGTNNIRTSIYSRMSTPDPPPANDECSGAISLTVNSDNRCTALYSGNTGYATQSRQSCIATGYEAKDVWFKFTATATTQRVTVSPLSTDNYIFEVFSGSCTNMISLACVNSGAYGEPDAALVNNLTVGAEYYIRVWMYFGAASPSTMFSVCVSTTTTLVNEDNCSGAMEVIPSASSQIGNTFFTINNTGATQSMPGCFGTAEDDVWFKFTATATRHRILIGTTNDINPVLELYSGSCGSLTSLSCRYVNNGGVYGSLDVDVQNLVPGTTYYYRVYGSSNNNIRTSISTRMTSYLGITPVKISSFIVKSGYNSHTLQWQTEVETNNKGFEIQYSRDGSKFDSLSFVPAKSLQGFSGLPLQYSFDYFFSRPQGGKIYYRLKQTDLDGKFEFTKVLIATILLSEGISIYPNPVNEQIIINESTRNEYTYLIMDQSNRILRKGILIGRSIDVSSLPNGIYILQLRSRNSVMNCKFNKY